MIRKFTLFILIIYSLCGFPQDDTTGISISEKKTVLIIPFNTMLYHNDAARDIAQHGNMNYNKILNYFRLRFDKNLVDSLSDTCIAVSLLSSYTHTANEDLISFYNEISYFLSDAMDYNSKQNPPSLASKLALTKKEENKQKYKPATQKGEIRSPVTNTADKFLNIKFIDNEFIKSFCRKYNADLVLSINEFDIKGDYSSPYKVSMNSHNMVIKIHYSIFDYTGKYLFGSFAIAEYPATDTDLKNICTKHLPGATHKIKQSIIRQ